MDITAASILGLTFALLLLSGVPIAYCIGIATLVTFLNTMDYSVATTVVSQRMATGLDSFALLAIPFFILAGQLMNRGGIARRLIEFAKALVGRLPGGLAYVNVLACMLFGSISGSAAAAAAAIGGFMAPLMNKEGYDKNFSASVNISSATTGLLIPPSNILIVYSLASGGVSITALFIAGYLPGILLGLALMVCAGVIAKTKRYRVGAGVTLEQGTRAFWDALPSMLLIVIVMGGIIAGIFTPTEASAIAVLYTFILSVIIYREVKWSDLPSILVSASLTTAVVFFLIGTSMAMSWVMSYASIPQGISQALLALTENKTLVLLIMLVVLLGVGTFMDMTPAVLIFTPIFLPVALKFGVDPIHFGILLIFALCIGLCTPPVGSVLFIGCGVAGTTITAVMRSIWPFFGVMLACLLAVTYIPWLSLFLVRLFGY